MSPRLVVITPMNSDELLLDYGLRLVRNLKWRNQPFAKVCPE